IAPEYTEEEKALMDRAVPHLEGLTLDEAQKRLAESGLSFSIIGEGSAVVETLPGAGTMVAPKSKIMLYTVSNVDIEESYVPDLIGMSYFQAKEVLEGRGLYISRISPRPANSSTMVISMQDIEFGSLVPMGSCINVELIDKDDSIYGIY
ncbi:MAG: PASTA domain-containing protein, partial [Oscillospiraceae bacterium]|nr:PASTA domain-containing protein [Oscillospiraceae bacterium]